MNLILLCFQQLRNFKNFECLYLKNNIMALECFFQYSLHFICIYPISVRAKGPYGRWALLALSGGIKRGMWGISLPPSRRLYPFAHPVTRKKLSKTIIFSNFLDFSPSETHFAPSMPPHKKFLVPPLLARALCCKNNEKEKREDYPLVAKKQCLTKEMKMAFKSLSARDHLHISTYFTIALNKIFKYG